MRRRVHVGLTIGVMALAAACGGGGAGTFPSTEHQLTAAEADHARMVSMRIRLDDLGPNWRRVASRSKAPAKCEPHPAGVHITAGGWKNPGVAFANGSLASVESDAIVFATPADAQSVLDDYTRPATVRCLERQVRQQFHPRHGVSLLGISTRMLERRPVADAFDGYRLTANMSKGKRIYQVYADVFLVRQDRALAAFTYVNAFTPAPANQENALARAVADRGAALPA